MYNLHQIEILVNCLIGEKNLLFKIQIPLISKTKHILSG